MDARLLNGITEFENQLRARGYQQLEPFFVLREGEVYDERNGGTVKFDRQRLERFADTQNRRVAESQDATPIIVGHTKRGKNEKDQPKIAGLATRFVVAPFYNTGTYGLQAVPWSKAENVQDFSDHPRRSAEVWTHPDLIDPISLLGATTPRLDLGLHRLQRATPEVSVEYSPRVPLTLEMCDMPEPSTDPKAPATPANKDAAAGGVDNPQMAQLQAQMQQMQEMFSILQPLIDEIKASQGMPGDPNAGGPPGGPPGGGMGGPPPGAPMPMGAPGGPPPGPGGPEPSQFNMGGGSPAGFGNTMIPTQMQAGYGYYPPYQTPAPAARQPMQFQAGGQQQVSYDPRDAQILQLQRQVQTMEQNMAAAGINALLDGLQNEITIDRTYDFNRLIKLSRADLDVEVQMMRKTRAPVQPALPGEAVPLHFQAGAGTGPRPGGPAPAGAPVQLSLQQAMEAGGYGMGGDPTLQGNGAVPQGPNAAYDAMIEAVRNRRKEDPMVAYRRLMGGTVDPATGKTIVPTRG